MPSAAVPPSDVTVQALNAAKGVQLKFWIKEANQAVGKKALTKTGTVNALRTKLAEFYGLDLAAAPEKPAGPITRGHDVQKRQFAYLRELWNEWISRPHHSCSARRLLVSFFFALPNPLPESPLLPAVTNDSVYALSHLARSGDHDAFIMLLRFRAVVQARAGSIIHLVSRLSASCMLTEASPAALPMSPVTTSTPPTIAAPAQSDEAVLLAACKADIAVLNRATSLCDVIAQVEAGDVARIRQLYGPCTGRAAISLWQSIKCTVCRRERLYLQLQDEFCGDKDHFFGFFSIQTTPEVNGKSLKRKAKRNAPVEHLQPLRKVDEAISRRDKNLAELMVSDEYNDEGRFCSEKWEAKWLGRNRWEIWRAIGKERY
ncbi:uncharacterized protein HD556DRAFT_1226739 [Suillus plorans]|uniref:Uncharacterized protein n=1 Tax=Suillus plorans TaxID=116603 RepID=A0A9P7DVE8_9AGAM|nr:uncharacterized protein HD556DRAFT_1226739 [Suillus plorans]KAG1803882.1 hypothetical protein HD556DRAFT_1226739 [Suillus plorans]